MLFALLYETRGCGLILLVVCLLWDSRLPLLGRNLFLFLLSSLDWFQIRYELVGQSFRYCWFWIWETVWFQFSGDQESKLRYMSYLWSCEDGVSRLGSCILTRQDQCTGCVTNARPSEGWGWCQQVRFSSLAEVDMGTMCSPGLSLSDEVRPGPGNLPDAVWAKPGGWYGLGRWEPD